MKLKMETARGWRVVDDIGDIEYGRVHFNNRAAFNEYIALRFQDDIEGLDHELVLLDRAGQASDYAPEVIRCDVIFRNEARKTYFVNARSFLLNDEDGGTIDVIPAAKRPEQALVKQR